MVLRSPMFERVWGDSTQGQQIEVVRYIVQRNVAAVRSWVQNHPTIDLGEMNIRRLRERARRAGVRNYSRKDKSELIIAIQFRESSNENKDRTGGRTQGVDKRDATPDRPDSDETKFAPGPRGVAFVPDDIHPARP